MFPIPPPNPIDKNQIPIPKTDRVSESHEISLVLNSQARLKNPELFDGESKEAPFFRVWVKEGTKEGRAKLFWQGETIEANAKTTLLTGEELLLSRTSLGKSFEWRILERKLSEDTGSSETPSPLEKGLTGILERILHKEEGQISQENAISFLKSYFPFLEWKAETPYFEWEWEGGNAEGYLDMEEQNKIFVLFLETKEDGPSLYRFFWKKEDASDLILTAVYTSSKMYLHIGQNRKKFKQFLEESGVKFQELRIQYKPSLQRREWTA
ncbi:hypothetical protein EHO59_14605 [Leptospira semungkisensis]|uniref:Uncharacterized protein n=1 Tax=Leptospira semungkisensis TaxID=2484985 RepID=A0A4R9FKQ4_9LEPT|nr:hypothetical protein [Leptospira semungkisensis]TGJ99107.1 hypothetical protein EHO59_14605 [Leptospira semungkisensis]